MPNKGLLLVISDPPAAFEEEFNAWYDTDHIPERLAIPGFETGTRFVSADRARRYLALYDLAHVGVLETPEYLAFSGTNFTPWSKRVVARCRIDRVVAVQAFPGNAPIGPGSRLLLVRVTGAASAVEAFSSRCFTGHPNVSQVRGFSEETAERMHLLVGGHGDLARLIDSAAAAESAIRIDAVETYLPY